VSRINSLVYQRHKSLQSTLVPALRRFAPDVIILSAGFDAHTGDPVGQLNLQVGACRAGSAVPLCAPVYLRMLLLSCAQTADFEWIAELLGSVCPRIVSILEGGYGVNEQLAECVAAHVQGLLNVSGDHTEHLRDEIRKRATDRDISIQSESVNSTRVDALLAARAPDTSSVADSNMLTAPACSSPTISERPSEALSASPPGVAVISSCTSDAFPIDHDSMKAAFSESCSVRAQSAVAASTSALPIPKLGHLRRVLQNSIFSRSAAALLEATCDGAVERALQRALSLWENPLAWPAGLTSRPLTPSSGHFSTGPGYASMVVLPALPPGAFARAVLVSRRKYGVQGAPLVIAKKCDSSDQAVTKPMVAVHRVKHSDSSPADSASLLVSENVSREQATEARTPPHSDTPSRDVNATSVVSRVGGGVLVVGGDDAPAVASEVAAVRG
jgi:hypothetical protein